MSPYGGTNGKTKRSIKTASITEALTHDITQNYCESKYRQKNCLVIIFLHFTLA